MSWICKCRRHFGDHKIELAIKTKGFRTLPPEMDIE